MPAVSYKELACEDDISRDFMSLSYQMDREIDMVVKGNELRCDFLSKSFMGALFSSLNFAAVYSEPCESDWVTRDGEELGWTSGRNSHFRWY